MEQLAPVNPLQPTTPLEAPLKPTNTPLQTAADPWKPAAGTLKALDANVWGFIGHPSGGGATESTASGPSTTSGSSTFYGTSVSGSFSRLKSLESTDPYTSASHSGTPTLSKRQYVAVLPAEPSACSSLRIPANAVATSDMSPAWCQYQTTSVGAPLTPVYCSLTPSRTDGQPLRVFKEDTGEPIQQAFVEGTSGHEAHLKAFEKNQSSLAEDSLNGGHRKSSLLLNETPLQVASLPKEVQALIQAGTAQSHETPKQFPEWFDAEAGCIRRECLPSLPTFRINLNTSVAKLSVASRDHHRTRLPGEPAKVAVTSCHHVREKTLRRLSRPDASLLRRQPDPTSSLLEPPAQATPSSCGGKQSPILSDVTEGLAARSRRVRFATVACAREYKERSPSLTSESPGVSKPLLRTASLTAPHEEDSDATDSPQVLGGQKGAQARALEIAQRMIGIIERLLNTPALRENDQSTEKLQSCLKLLQAFTAKCAGRLPALCFFADTLEKCQELVEHKLPEDEREPLLQLIEASKVPLLSRDAVIKLHRIRHEMRHPKDLDLLLIPLDVLQRLRVCDRRRSVTGLSLYAAVADDPLVQIEHKLQPNVFFAVCFLRDDSACGVVSARQWTGCSNPRAFAVDVLKQCQEQMAAAYESNNKVEGGCSPGEGARTMWSSSLSLIVDAALQKTQEYGMCSLALLSLDNAGEKLRFATCGFLRLLVLRRSGASGVLCRVAESPLRNAAAAAETQLFRWPSKEKLIEELYQQQQEGTASERSNIKADLDAGTRRQALMRVVEWAEAGDGWNSRGLVEQELAVQEGDFFIVADDVLFDVISSEEIRYLFSCCLTSMEVKDLTDFSLCTIPSCLPTLLKRLLKHRVPSSRALLQRYQRRQQRFASQVVGRRSVAETAEACPFDLTIAAGWIHKKPGKAEAYAPSESH
ncbi:hypothetical protein Esti_004820 [Eimeria stiedai]